MSRWGFVVRRYALEADVPFTVPLPSSSLFNGISGQSFSQVHIGNGTAGDLRVWTDDAAHYLILTPGFERTVTKNLALPFGVSDDAFNVQADEAGTIVVIWS